MFEDVATALRLHSRLILLELGFTVAFRSGPQAAKCLSWHVGCITAVQQGEFCEDFWNTGGGGDNGWSIPGRRVWRFAVIVANPIRPGPQAGQLNVGNETAPVVRRAMLATATGPMVEYR